MGKLTENIVYNRTKTSLENVRRLNLWGCDIDDVDICAKMPKLEVLALSVNSIRSLEPLANCPNLQELYVRKNELEDLNELEHLKSLPKLTTLWLEENPCCQIHNYRSRVLKILPKLESLDNKAVSKDEVALAQTTSDSPPPPVNALQSQSMYECEYSMEPIDMDTVRRYSQMSQSYAGDLFPPGDAMVPDTTPMTEVAYYNPIAPPSMLSTSQIFQFPTDMDTSGTTGHQHQHERQQHQHQQQELSQSWPDFSIDENAPVVTFQTDPQYESRRSSVASLWAASHKMKSLAFPRRRFSRSRSCSPARRTENIVSAIWLLLDELDQNGLRMVIDEAQKRIKKQR